MSTSPTPTMSTSPTPDERRHDLDALRAAAMLLGIIYHISLSFAEGFPWFIQDVAQSKSAFIFQTWVHGFRMPLFMLVSGFFTAMLWRQKGLKALLWHRCRRVLFPCLLGVVTLLPMVTLAAAFASERNAANKRTAAKAEPASANVWAAIQLGDAVAMDAHLRNPATLTNLHPTFHLTPLTWAVLNGQNKIAVVLLDRGAGINERNSDGGTALHSAAFLGRAEIGNLLLQRGANIHSKNTAGETALASAGRDFETVQFISGILGIAVDRTAVEEGRLALIPRLGSKDLPSDGVVTAKVNAESPNAWKRGGIIQLALTEWPIFSVLWFLWMLVWLVAIFSIYALVVERFRWRVRGHWLVLSPANLLWLVPLTLIPATMMSPVEIIGIGPETSMSIIPMPHVLLYYMLFFFFGALYYDCDDRAGRLGSSWRWLLPVTLIVIFPLALEFSTGSFGFRAALLPPKFHRPASVFFQSLFAWTMSFACIGLFRATLTRENRTLRYLSDSAYWLYLAHLPLCFVGQAIISPWALPAWIKLPLLSLVLIALLLLTYQFLVRYTWLGRMLNGPRKRPSRNDAPNGIAIASP